MVRLSMLFLLSLMMMTGYTMDIKQKHIYGYVESIYVDALDIKVKAKLDTGAKSSSLSAINIQEHEQDGQILLTFTVPLKSGAVTLTRPLAGSVKIKKRAGESAQKKIKVFHRPVVNIKITLGSQTQEIAVNLTNRKRFIYPLLLGRSTLNKLRCLVDPQAAFLANNHEKK